MLPPLRRFRRTLWVSLLAAALAAPEMIAAEGPIAAVQATLQREKVYAGEITGELDDKTRAALIRYQTRRGLPMTGEIDTATLQALQQTSTGSRATLEAVPSPKVLPEPVAQIAEKDREFLEKVESGAEPLPPAVAAPAPAPPSTPQPPAPVAVSAAPVEVAPPTVLARPEAPVSAPRKTAPSRAVAETPKRAPVRKTRPVAVAEPPPVAVSRKAAPEPVASAPAPKPAPTRKVVRGMTSDLDADPVGSHGTRVIRRITTTTAPDGETIVREERTTIPRAERVQPRRKGLFDRIFNDDDDDDDD